MEVIGIDFELAQKINDKYGLLEEVIM